MKDDFNGRSLAYVLWDVENMMQTFGQPCRGEPTVRVSPEEKKLRAALVAEESKELLDAIEQDNLDKIADGIADVIVVTLGAAVTYGIPVNKVWNEVMKTNMAKANGPKDPVTGKHLKPPGWKPPDIKQILRESGWKEDE